MASKNATSGPLAAVSQHVSVSRPGPANQDRVRASRFLHGHVVRSAPAAVQKHDHRIGAHRVVPCRESNRVRAIGAAGHHLALDECLCFLRSAHSATRALLDVRLADSSGTTAAGNACAGCPRHGPSAARSACRPAHCWHRPLARLPPRRSRRGRLQPRCSPPGPRRARPSLCQPSCSLLRPRCSSPRPTTDHQRSRPRRVGSSEQASASRAPMAKVEARAMEAHDSIDKPRSGKVDERKLANARSTATDG